MNNFKVYKELAPFSLIKVQGIISLELYFQLIQKLYIPFDTSIDHDDMFHINPALLFIRNHCPNYMERIRDIVQQKGTIDEKRIDYIMFEASTFFIYCELIKKVGTRGLMAHNDITNFVNYVMLDEKFEIDEKTIKDRFLNNFIYLDLDKHLPLHHGAIDADYRKKAA